MLACVLLRRACPRPGIGVRLLAAALLAPLLLAPGSARGQTAYVTGTIIGKVTPIDTATNTAGPPIAVGSEPVGIAITPDGSTAYVANFASNSVTPIDTATNTAGPAIAVGSEPTGIAITPDGKTAYVTNRGGDSVTPIDTTTKTAGSPIPISVAFPFAIAITPDGRTLYVGGEGNDAVAVIDTTTNTVVDVISLTTPSASIAITPDGKTAYVVGFGGVVTPIDTATNVAGAPFAIGTAPFGIAISPDGQKAYVVNEFSTSVTPFLTATNAALAPISTGPGLPVDDAITPDGKTLYVTNTDDGEGGAENAVTAISTATNTVVGSPIAVGGLAFEIAITPAQAPIAAFVAQAAATLGTATSFDASASSDARGAIGTYRWEFGDGTGETTTSATTSHTYSAPGTYSVRLTVSDSGGCSTTFVFTGQTALCNGSSRASVVEPVTVASAASGSPASAAPAVKAPSPPIVSQLRARSRCVARVQLAGAPSSGSGGLAFSYTLNESASVLYVVKRRDGSPGRRTCGPAPGRTPGSYSEIGGVIGPGLTGANGVTLGSAASVPAAHVRTGRTIRLHLARAAMATGRHSVTLAQIAQGKQLAPGTYVLLVRATDSAGQRSNDATVKFFVVTG